MRWLIRKAVLMLSLSAASGSAKPGQGAALAAAASSSDTSSASPASLEQSARSGSPGSTPAAAPSSSSAEKNMHGRPVAQNGSRVNAGYVNRPAPGKSNGEDAVDAHASGAVAYAALGDGVGGWRQVGVDPSEYSSTLVTNSMNELAQHASAEGNDTADAKEGAGASEVSSDATGVEGLGRRRCARDALHRAHESTKGILGSSTLTVAYLSRGLLQIANLGDSGVIVCSQNKPDKIAYMTGPGQRSFNFPLQLADQETIEQFVEQEREQAEENEQDDGPAPAHDTPDDAEYAEVSLEPGDRVVLASDGVWDNLFPSEVAELALADENASATTIAGAIADAAEQAANSERDSPFTMGAKRSGWALENFGLQGLLLTGGKQDDTSVAVLRYCGDDSDRSMGSTEDSTTVTPSSSSMSADDSSE